MRGHALGPLGTHIHVCVRVRVCIYSAKEVIRWDTQHMELQSIRPLQFAGPTLNGTSAFLWGMDECCFFL